MSLRRRVLLGIVAVAVVLVTTNVVLAATFEGFLLARVDDQLIATVDRPALGGPRRPGTSDPPAVARARQAIELGVAVTDLYIATVDPDTGVIRQVGDGLLPDDQGPPNVTAGEVVARATTDGDPLEPFTVAARTGGGSWRVIAIEGRFDQALLVGVSLDELDAAVGRMQMVQILGTTAVLVALAAVSWWMVHHGVRPVTDMAGTADAIAAGDLSRRVEHVDERTEAGRLGAAFNTMLDTIEEAFRQRAASEERVRRFATDASHELRTPLTSIRGYTELWQRGGFRGEGELADAMRRMNEEAQRMGALVEDLLLLARLDQARPFDPTPVRLDLLAEDAVQDARTVDPDRPVELDVQPATVEGDEMRLRQVLGNLLANARTHTPQGTPVHVEVRSDHDHVRLVVADDGPGMAPDVAERIFERFYRANPARTRADGGTGLGLSIVAALVAAHDGRIDVVSDPGHGTRFVVELPVSPRSHPTI